jgi:hypothetical protein
MNRIVRTGAAVGVIAVLIVMMASVLVALPAPARAEEVKSPVGATMILNLLSQPRESRDSAYDQSVREEGPPRARTTAEAILSHVVVTVKNPCPPGTAHYEPPPLPGRRR